MMGFSQRFVRSFALLCASASLCLTLEGEGVSDYKSAVAKIAKTHAVKGEDRFFGFRRVTFDFSGHDAWVVFPEGEAAKGRPWTWTMQWSTAFVPRTGVTQLLASGWHHVTIDTFRHRMDEEGIRVSAAFQRFLVDELGLAPQANLVGLSWGGFFSVRYAVAHPDCVRKIYLDSPLLVYRQGRCDDVGPWAARCPANGDWMSDPEMPVNKAEALAKTGIPVLMLYGGHDQEVRPETNAELFEKRFRAAGGDLKVFCRPAYGHHPHGVEESEPTIRNFFMAKKGEDWTPGIRDVFSTQIR